MESFKKYDLWINTILFVACTIVSVIRLDFYTLICCYFIIGGWQVISMIVHAGNGWFTRKHSSRYYYHRIIAVIIGIGLIGLLEVGIWFFILIYFPMLFMSPVIAISYIILCNNELKELKKNHALSLK